MWKNLKSNWGFKLSPVLEHSEHWGGSSEQFPLMGLPFVCCLCGEILMVGGNLCAHLQSVHDTAIKSVHFFVVVSSVIPEPEPGIFRKDT